MRLNWANAGRLHRDFSRGNEIIPWFGVYIYIYTHLRSDKRGPSSSARNSHRHEAPCVRAWNACPCTEHGARNYFKCIAISEQLLMTFLRRWNRVLTTDNASDSAYIQARIN